MAVLNREVAKQLAWRLTSIGHPLAAGTIEATTNDLVRWCRGAILGPGHTVQPEEQAERLVEEARLTWQDGWPQRGGTVALRALFLALWPQRDGEQVGITMQDAIARGLMRPPCPECNDFGSVGDRPDREFCSCAEGARERQRHGNDRKKLNAPAPPPRPAGRGMTPVAEMRTITEEDMKKALEDEQRRKAAQLERQGLD